MKKQLLALLCALMLLLTGCKTAPQTEAACWSYFDTLVRLQASGRQSQAEKIAQPLLARLDAAFDRYTDSPGISGLYALNHAQGAWTKVEPELMELLLLCRDWYAEYPAVDVTRGALFDLWHAFREGGPFPDPEALKQAGALGGWEHVEFDEAGGRVRLTQAGMSLDLGAVAKGYACRLLGQALEQAGISDYLIDAGGNVLCGRRAAPYTVGVASGSDPDYLAVLAVSHLSLASSGDYQRYREWEGSRYHHIIDTQTGYPADSQFDHVTVLAEDAALGDLLSTCLFLMDLPQGQALAARAGVEVVWHTRQGETVLTDGAKALLQ